MKYRLFASTDIPVSAIGLGCMGFNHGYGIPDENESVRVMERALDLGINFWDTADAYANGKNEELVSRVLVPNRSKIFLATKFGFRPKEDGGKTFDASPDYIKIAVDRSLRRLKTDVIDLYYAHRVDPDIPIEETVGAMAGLIKAGKVRYLGLSEAGPGTIRRAHAVHPVSALQSEYSLLTRDVEKNILPLCTELKITFVPFSPLSRGLITNTLNPSSLAENDFRKTLPRYQKEYEENNMKLAAELAQLAAAKNCTAAQLSLAWILAQGNNIVPIPGTKKLKYLEENAGSTEITITASDHAAIEALLKKYPHTGPRYTPEHEKMVDRN